MKQDMNAYTAEDFQVWKTLFDRQVENLQTKGSVHYLTALKEMESVLNRQLIPDFRAINGFFQESTGWSIEVVPGLIPVEEFFELLADKKFCSSTWLRTMKQLDYLDDIFEAEEERQRIEKQQNCFCKFFNNIFKRDLKNLRC